MSAETARAHKPAVRRSPAPRAPRRTSGPSRPRELPRGVKMAGGAVALPAPGVRRRPLPAPAGGALAGAAEALKRLPDARWLDRLMRGQAWVVLIGIALMGIVAMQVSLLKMNAGIGRAVEHAGTLERQNADLRAAVSTLSSEERIQREAMSMGLHLPAAGDVKYLRARGAEDARKAAQVMRQPNSPELLAQAQAAAATGGAVAATPTAADGVTPAAGTTQAAPVATQEQQAAPAAQTAPPAQPQAQAAPPAQQQQQPGAQAAPTAQQPQAATAGAAAAPAAQAQPVATGASSAKGASSGGAAG